MKKKSTAGPTLLPHAYEWPPRIGTVWNRKTKQFGSILGYLNRESHEDIRVVIQWDDGVKDILRYWDFKIWQYAKLGYFERELTSKEKLAFTLRNV
jgi:hypothetical protein